MCSFDTLTTVCALLGRKVVAFRGPDMRGLNTNPHFTYRIDLNLPPSTLCKRCVGQMVDRLSPVASRFFSSDVLSPPPPPPPLLWNDLSAWWRCALALAHMIEMTESNIKGHCCASMALLIKQTFHPHNSNVWTKRDEGEGGGLGEGSLCR